MSHDEKSEFAKLFEQSEKELKRSYFKGDKVEAKVISSGKESVFVLVDSQEGIIHRSEFKEAPKVGEVITAYFMRKNEGMMELTLKASQKALSEGLQDAFDLETPVDGKVLEAVNGGFRVQVLGQMAFCPISQMDIKHVTDTTEYLNRKFEFIVTKYDERGRNIVVSRRKVLDLQKAENEGAFLEKTKEGDTVTGKVSRIEKFGAFVEIAPQIEGMVHISELSWSRVGHPNEVVQTGQLVTAKVLQVTEDDRGRLKISLSMKQAEGDPWVDAVKSLSIGTKLSATVQRVERFGIILTLRPGVTGLLPKEAIRQSSEEKDLLNKKQGDSLVVVVTQLNPNEKKISLALADDQDDSWKSHQSTTGGFGSLADQFKLAISKTKK